VFNGTAVNVISYFVSPTQVNCLLAASNVGRIVNVSVSGKFNISRSFVQFGEFRFSSVEWDGTLSSVYINATSPLPVVPSLVCSRLFSPFSLTLFGLNPVCSISANSIVVSVGKGSTLMFHALDLQPLDRLFTLTGVPSEIFSVALPNVSISSAVSNPTVLVQGSTSLGSCSALSLQLSIPSPSSISRPSQFAPVVTWSFVTASIASQNASAVRLAFINRLVNVTSAGFVFLSDSWKLHGLPGGLPSGNYTVSYTVAAWYQRRVSGNVTFSIAPQDLPVITSIQVPSIIRRSSVTEFSAVIDVSVCSANMALSYVWQIRTAAGLALLPSFDKRFVVPQYTLGLFDTTYTVTLTLNGVVSASSVFKVSRLPPVAVISGGDTLRLSTSGGRISAASSYDPNYAANEQPGLAFDWSCQNIDLSLSITSKSYLDIRSLSSTITCTVTVSYLSLSSSATVTVEPVPGSPPALTITASAPRVSLVQSLVLSVAVTSGNAQQYSYQWTASPKPLAASDAITSLQVASVVLKSGFLSESQPSAVFKCRVTHVVTGVYAERSCLHRL